MEQSPKQTPSEVELGPVNSEGDGDSQSQGDVSVILESPANVGQGSENEWEESEPQARGSQQFPMREPFVPAQRYKRPQSPDLEWNKDYDGDDNFLNGRVLVIDYAKQEQSQRGMCKVATHEFDSIDGLKHLYSTPDHVGEQLLRVIHCQDAEWANQFLLHKFNIDPRDEIVGTDFGEWVNWKRPERRGGKPFLNGKTWETTHDPWRGISRTSFGLDGLRLYECPDYPDSTEEYTKDKVFELNRYDNDDNPKYGYDAITGRIGCYIQHKDDVSEAPDYPGIKSPYDEAREHSEVDQYFPQLDELDNGNVIIIFENSKFERPWDTFIGPRQEMESRWRRLPFHLDLEPHDLSNDDAITIVCIKIIVSDVWKSIIYNWGDFICSCITHVTILEEKICDGPADESRAPELWANSSMWLRMKRLVTTHWVLVQEISSNLQTLIGDPEAIWLDDEMNDLSILSESIENRLENPTTNLAELMYKSVGIRDSRHSLQLNTSMWRLSWITFIFLPLTFLSTFFGMNVTTFADNPSIRYYFAAAGPMMVVVFTSWYFFKHSLASQHQTPFTRGIYEEMFSRMALLYPQLWARTGPRNSFRPQTLLDKLRWHLILHWNDPDKTTCKTSGNEIRFEDLSVTTRLKRYFTSRWTDQLHTLDGVSPPTTLEDGNLNDTASFSNGRNEVEALEVRSAQSASVTVANDQTIEVPMPTGGPVPPQVQSRIASPTSRHSSIPGRDRSNSRRSGSSGGTNRIIVEERPVIWLGAPEEGESSEEGELSGLGIPYRARQQTLSEVTRIRDMLAAGRVATPARRRPVACREDD